MTPSQADSVAAQTAQLSGAVRGVATLVEAKFVEVGGKLDRSIEILTALTDTFGGLTAELQSEELADATRHLTNAAAIVADLGRDHGRQGDALRRLDGLLATVERHAQDMNKSVKGASGLAIHVKIEAAGLGHLGTDFLSFSAEIDRSLRNAVTDLATFSEELAGLARQIATARAEDQAVAQRHADAIESIPRRLVAGVETIDARGKQAVALAQLVAQRSDQIKARIAQAVMALQVGDTTRQRAEHVDHALTVLSGVLEAADRGVAPADGGFVAACTALQSAQLVDTADELGGEMNQLLGSLERLAADAGEIVRLGNQVTGATDKARGSFVTELEADVDQALRLVQDYLAAHTVVDRTLAAASAAAVRLQDHIRTIHSMETDLRIMSLNTSLKCGRIGHEARSLAAVAQELRAYASALAVQAETVTAGIAEVAAIAKPLVEGRDASRDGEAGAVVQVMTGSIGRLAATGKGLDAALEALERDSQTVSGLLTETAKGMTIHTEIGTALRHTAADLRQILGTPEVDHGEQSAHPLLGEFERRYTMARERDVHRAILGTAAQPEPSQAQDVDDMLF